MKLFLRYEVQAQEARKTKDRRRSGDRRRARLQVEPLEGRQLLSWGSVSPAQITPPVNSPPSTHVYPQAPSDPGTAIELKALALGSSFTGAPISGLETVPGGYRIQYQNCDIYDSPITGAHEVHGAIRAEYAALAHETDASGRDAQLVVGLPTSDEMNVPGVSGARMNTFQDGAIYWSPSTGAHVVYGAIGGLYNSLGGPTSFLGLPISDELGIPGGRVSYFQNGRKIVWTPQGGAYAV